MALLRIAKPGLVSSTATIIPDDVAPTHIDSLPPELDADWVARLEEDEILHVECQGYSKDGFTERVLWYHLGLALRNRGKRRVRSVVLWLMPLAEKQRAEVVTVHDISVQVTMVDLTRVPAESLLRDGRTACFAAGADAGGLGVEALCSRVASVLAARQASWAERHMAVVAAAKRGRYYAMVSAMEQANLEPVIIEDLVNFGEDRGVDRSFERLFSRRVGRALTPQESKTLELRRVDMGVDRLDDVLFSMTGDALARWLADPTAA